MRVKRSSKGKTLAIDLNLFTRASQKTAALGCERRIRRSAITSKLVQAAKIKALEENSLFSWWVTDDNEDMLFPALQTAAPPPLALLTKINSCFHLLQRSFSPAPADTAPGILCYASLPGCREAGITSLSQYTCWTLIHPPSHPRLPLKTSGKLFCSGHAQKAPGTHIKSSLTWVTFPVSRTGSAHNGGRIFDM